MYVLTKQIQGYPLENGSWIAVVRDGKGNITFTSQAQTFWPAFHAAENQTGTNNQECLSWKFYNATYKGQQRQMFAPNEIAARRNAATFFQIAPTLEIVIHREVSL